MHEAGRDIYCAGCERVVLARLTSGREVVPTSPERADEPFWICRNCRNFVRCHSKTADNTRPIGIIATPAIRSARRLLHAAMDPLWQEGHMRRAHLYGKLASLMGLRSFHSAELRTLDECREAYRHVLNLRSNFAMKGGDA